MGRRYLKGGIRRVGGGEISLPIGASLRLVYFLIISITWLLFFFLSVVEET